MSATDPDLIACVYPVEGERSLAPGVVRSEANHSRYHAPYGHVLEPEYRHDRRERGATQPLEDSGDASDLHECLQLRFSHPPRTHNGFVFGWDPNSDIVLFNGPAAVSFHHFSITFDSHGRLIVRDLASLNGTEVTYDDQGQGKRSNFVWIVGGDRIVRRVTTIIINIHRQLKFRLVVFRHDVASQTYIDNVNLLLQGSADTGSLVGQLNIRSHPQTERASGSHTPGTGPIAVKATLGEGAFGVVTRVWDVSTASVYALKEPSARAIRKNQVDMDGWRKEARLLSRVSHQNIIKLLRAEFTPTPRLCLEYMPGGSLDNYENLLANECGQILCQCLSALSYLHGLDPPIVHRDIKPGNILVQSRDAGCIWVKFGDFGLSRQSADPTTICGTLRYFPPEMHNEKKSRAARQGKHSYTAAVDIWSLGVVIVELLPQGLPLGKDNDLSWCRKLVKKLNKDLEEAWDSLLHFLADFMVTLEPKDRGSAQECYDLARSTFGEGFQTPRQIDYYHDENLTAPAGDQQTVLWYDDSAGLEQTQRRQRSDAPPPTSSQSARKRAKQSSSSGKDTTKRRGPSEPRLSQIHGLFDPLAEMGGGSSLAAMGSHQQRQGSESDDTWPPPPGAEPAYPAYDWAHPMAELRPDSHHDPELYGPFVGDVDGGVAIEQPRALLEPQAQLGEEWTDAEERLAAELLASLGEA